MDNSQNSYSNVEKTGKIEKITISGISQVGCKATGHTTGACDENDKCWCSEDDYNFFQDVGEWLEKVDISEVVSNQINKFQRKIGKSN